MWSMICDYFYLGHCQMKPLFGCKQCSSSPCCIRLRTLFALLVCDLHTELGPELLCSFRREQTHRLSDKLIQSTSEPSKPGQCPETVSNMGSFPWSWLCCLIEKHSILEHVCSFSVLPYCLPFFSYASHFLCLWGFSSPHSILACVYVFLPISRSLQIAATRRKQ